MASSRLLPRPPLRDAHGPSGTVAQERITHEAGATTPEALAENELLQLIREAGRTPVERDTVYNVIEQ